MQDIRETLWKGHLGGKVGRGQRGGGEECVENQKEGTKRAVRRQAAVLHPEAGGLGYMGGVGGVATSKRRLGEPPEMQAAGLLCRDWVLSCSVWFGRNFGLRA